MRSNDVLPCPICGVVTAPHPGPYYCRGCGRALDPPPPRRPVFIEGDRVVKGASVGTVVHAVSRRGRVPYLRVWVTTGPLAGEWGQFPRDGWIPILDREGGTCTQVCRECNRVFRGAAADLWCRTCSARLEGRTPEAERR